jgi:hypothetical protein
LATSNEQNLQGLKLVQKSKCFQQNPIYIDVIKNLLANKPNQTNIFTITNTNSNPHQDKETFILVAS